MVGKISAAGKSILGVLKGLESVGAVPKGETAKRKRILKQATEQARKDKRDQRKRVKD